MKITKNSILSSILFGLLVATLMALEEFYEGEMSATTAIEEVIAHLSILILLFIVLVLPFQKIINILNEKISWKEKFVQRISIEAVVVITFSILFGCFFGYWIHLYIEHNLPTEVVILRTILFLIITSSLIMALLELRHLQDEKEELVQLSERLEKENIATLYNSLKQQVNPHFLFNSLSVLSSLVYYDAKKADLFIQNFSDIYRYVLDINKKKLASLGEELQFLESYLFLQKIRFGENIHIQHAIREEEKKLFLPPLSLQLVFENIMKHNTISKDYPMHISMKINDNMLEIKNTLKPRKSLISGGIGINNLKEKYQLLKATSPVFEKNETAFKVSLPLLHPQQQL